MIITIIYIFSETRRDENIVTVLKSENSKDALKFHQKCLDRYSHKKTLQKIVRDRERQKDEEEEKRKRVCLNTPLTRSSNRQKRTSGIFFA